MRRSRTSMAALAALALALVACTPGGGSHVGKLAAPGRDSSAASAYPDSGSPSYASPAASTYGNPASPQPWDGRAVAGVFLQQPRDSRWDVIVHSMKQGPSDAITPMAAQHGPDCGAPPATHPIQDASSSVFICRNHMMTATKAAYDDASVIYLTPPALLDVSTGTATVSFKMSTLRASVYDWVDFWLTPYQSNLVFPLAGSDEDSVDGQGPPQQALQIRMANGNSIYGDTYFEGNFYQDFRPTNLGAFSRPPFLESLLVNGASAATRMSVELRVSRTHVRFGMPAQQGLNLPAGMTDGIWWVDNDLPVPLDWPQAVFQIGHHSYSPDKFGDYAIPLSLQPDTWHWSDFHISSFAPLNIDRATPGTVGNNGSPAGVSLAKPAPTAGMLRFAAIGSDMQVSFDGGQTWQRARRQAQSPSSQRSVANFYDNYWMPIPEGTTNVQFRGTDPVFPGGLWAVHDITVWSS